MKPTWPIIETGPVDVREVEASVRDGLATRRYAVHQPMRVVALAGLVPLVTWPGHE